MKRTMDHKNEDTLYFIKNRIIVLMILCFSLSATAQKLTGKWIVYNGAEVYSTCHVYEFEKRKLNIYNFDQFYTTTKTKINYRKGAFTRDMEHAGRIEDLVIKFKINGDVLFFTEESVNDYVFENHPILQLMKLVPTQMHADLSEVEGHSFLIKNDATEKTIIDLKKSSCETRTDPNNLACNFTKIEKIDDTYFLVLFYNRSKREEALVIKEIHKDKIVVYVPTSDKAKTITLQKV
ncbi:hypothetical protein [uncultured Aquimarina sp.]|uniref:hypothetical protein n=1 Tax=uncultured Aquimarina sp. TaxID=575652 RepID=UPI00261321C8|nr:hypothetical protein [uncultured Aquimarina sp.]